MKPSEYTALSYTWGPQSDLERLHVQDFEGFREPVVRLSKICRESPTRPLVDRCSMYQPE